VEKLYLKLFHFCFSQPLNHTQPLCYYEVKNKMKNTTIIILTAAFALVAAALIGVTFAQLATPNPTAVQQTIAPWANNANPNGAVPYCYNATGVVPAAGYCVGPQAQNVYGYSAQGCHGYGAQGTNQGWFGGMMGGRGMMGRGW
jgi:hypothetical protein